MKTEVSREGVPESIKEIPASPQLPNLRRGDIDVDCGVWKGRLRRHGRNCSNFCILPSSCKLFLNGLGPDIWSRIGLSDSYYGLGLRRYWGLRVERSLSGFGN